jgi:hypothetical protein
MEELSGAMLLGAFAALAMTAKTDNGKSEMRGFFAVLRMTTKKQIEARLQRRRAAGRSGHR